MVEPTRSEGGDRQLQMAVAKSPLSLEITFEVGERERHRLRFFYNRFWGNGRISVDDAVIRRFFELFSLSTSRWYRFTLGDEERHDVEIEKVRKWVLAGFRDQYIRVYIDGDLRSSTDTVAEQPIGYKGPSCLGMIGLLVLAIVIVAGFFIGLVGFGDNGNDGKFCTISQHVNAPPTEKCRNFPAP